MRDIGICRKYQGTIGWYKEEKKQDRYPSKSVSNADIFDAGKRTQRFD